MGNSINSQLLWDAVDKFDRHHWLAEHINVYHFSFADKVRYKLNPDQVKRVRQKGNNHFEIEWKT